jgi:hypothetical protein
MPHKEELTSWCTNVNVCVDGGFDLPAGIPPMTNTSPPRE